MPRIDPPLKYTPPAAPAIVAVWAGLSQIELYFAGDDHPFVNIGVRDHSAPMGETTIHDAAGLAAKVDEWVAENAGEDIAKYFVNHRD
jgi:hypothetical protein